MVKVGRLNLTEDQRKRTFHLPEEQAVIVPSTSGVKTQTRISPAKLNTRVNNVRRFLAQRFGGFTDVKARGGFVLRNGRIVKERVIVVRSFATTKDFKKFQPEVVRQIGQWGRKWKQESVSYEHEGDLFIIEPRSKNAKVKVMKKVIGKRLVNVKAPRIKRKITPQQRKVMMANLTKARKVRARKGR